jgi:DNA-binding beta-propeller fold protein YncE
MTPVYVGVGPVDGRVYVVDRGRNAVVVYGADGKRLRDLQPGGTGPAPQDTLKPWRPLALGFAPDGTLYVADVEGDQHIAVFSPPGVRIGTIGDGLPLGRSGRHLAFPNGIVAFDDALVVSDSNNGRLLLMDRVGTVRRVVLVGGLPRGAAALDAGRFVVADASMHSLRVFSSEGNELQRTGDFGSATGQFAYPAGVAVDDDGRVYVADTGNARVQVVRIPGAGAPARRGPTGPWPWTAAALVLASAAIAFAVWGLLRNRSSRTARAAESEL